MKAPVDQKKTLFDNRNKETFCLFRQIDTQEIQNLDSKREL